MINLYYKKEKTLSSYIEKISACNTIDEINNFYATFIEEYKQLDQKYKFTEHFNEDYVYEQIENQYRIRNNSPLFCIPVAVKDIFNSKVLPTSMGSEIWKDFRPGNNARILDEIQDRGGLIFSKTTTAEFAVHFISPSKTLNPFNKDYITGTSSSGSAVSVSCGAIPIALATQTAGSITRPSSFCGTFGFKPTFGALDRTGVLKTNDTLDTIGLIGSDISGIRTIFNNILIKSKDYPFSKKYFEQYLNYKNKPNNKIKLSTITSQFKYYEQYERYVKDDFEKSIIEINKSFKFEDFGNVDFINHIHEIHENIYAKSLSYYFKNEIKQHEFISDIMTKMIKEGEKVSTEDYNKAIQLQPEFRKKFDNLFSEVDFILTPSTASVAPVIGQIEKYDTSLIWTFLGYPTISIPLFKNESMGLPFGLQIVAKKYDDFAVLDFANKIAKLFN
jgi:Asp-tRNA(Asn)/Glu-tRNA(Gln) amidotransferase A subunit family amidase